MQPSKVSYPPGFCHCSSLSLLSTLTTPNKQIACVSFDFPRKFIMSAPFATAKLDCLEHCLTVRENPVSEKHSSRFAVCRANHLVTLTSWALGLGSLGILCFQSETLSKKVYSMVGLPSVFGRFPCPTLAKLITQSPICTLSSEISF